MKLFTTCAISLFLFSWVLELEAQYLENPSMEGTAGIGLVPPGWLPFGEQSSPDTEPLDCDDFPASHGATYLTLVARGYGSDQANTREACQTMLSQSLVEDVCYTISLDLASRSDLGHYEWGKGFINYSAPSKLHVYGSDSSTETGQLLGTVHPTSPQWDKVFIHFKANEQIDYLTIEVELISPGEQNGHVLIDNVSITEEFENTVVLNDTFEIAELPIALEASEGSNYVWTPESGLSCTNCQSPQVSSSNSRTYTCLFELASNGCLASELFILTFLDTPDPPDPPIASDFKIPNVFTPNGDGINDRFEITALPQLSVLRVYDRSGREVYTADPYENLWDGTDMDGNILEEGTYWYVLITPGLNGQYKGPVYLKRE